MSHPRRAAAVLALTALALALPAAPALAQDDPLSHLGAVTEPVVEVLAPSPSPSPSPTPLLPVPEPLAPLVEPVARTVGEAVTDLAGEEEPVTGQGAAPQPVAGPAEQPAPAPAAPQAAARSGTGWASLDALPDARGVRTGTRTAAAPGLGAAPLLAAAPAYALPGLPEPLAAPSAEVAVPRPASGPATPAGLPALVVAVAAVAVAAAGAGHVAELRVRRAAVPGR